MTPRSIARTTSTGISTSDGFMKVRLRDRCALASVAALLSVVWVIPPEGLLQGEGTWPAVAWLTLAALLSMSRLLSPSLRAAAASPAVESNPVQPFPVVAKFRRHGMDVAVFLLVFGHIASGLVVLVTAGQKRACANLMLGWLGLGAAWWVMRQVVINSSVRTALLNSLIAMACGSAVLGLWQHTISLPGMVADFGPRIRAFREAQALGAASPLEQELQRDGIPTTEPALTLFEKRLLDSREPFGMFALANTLGGMLASALVVWVVWRFPGCWTSSTTTAERRHQLLLACGITVLLAWCLFLTKSRTALLAVLLVLGMISLIMLARRLTIRWRLGALTIGITTLLSLTGFLLLAGLWDWQVFSEAPKSLTYRWQYWRGSAALLAESPWLGVGPGQFRSEYLRVKLPEASEEIADPHNAFMDVWLNGGLVAFFGLMVLVSRLVLSLVRPSAPADTTVTGRNSASGSPAIDVGIGSLGVMVALFASDLLAGGWDDRWLGIALVWALTYAMLIQWPAVADTGKTSLGMSAGLLTLMVHLQGAGGAEMAGVMTWGWFLAVGATAPDVSHSTAEDNRSAASNGHVGMNWRHSVAAPVWCGLWLIAVAGLWWPDQQSRGWMLMASQAWSRGDLGRARSALELASKADAWNPRPWEMQADLIWQTGRTSESGGQESLRAGTLQAARESLDQAERRDPANPMLRHQRARWTAEAARQDGNFELGRSAIEEQRRALKRYPTQSLWMAELAEWEHDYGSEENAKSWAGRALELDEINRRWGHADRQLPLRLRGTMERLASGAREPAGGGDE